MANASIYNALIQPLRSVADYDAQYAERDMAQARNALLQMQMKQAQQGMQQQAAVKNAFAQYGASPQAVNALMAAGAYPEGMKLQEQLKAQAQEAMRRDALRALQPTQAIDANRVSGVTGPRPEALSVVGKRRPFDPASMLAAGLPVKEVEGIRDLVAPTKEVKEYADERLPDGRVIRTAMMKDGTVQRTDVTPFFKPEIKNTGAAWAAIDPVTRQATTVAPITMSASERDASARGWANLNLDREKFKAQKDKEAAPPKPLPAGIVKAQTEALDAIGVASSINADLGTLEKQVAGGALKFGPVSNLVNTGRNMAGISNEESRNFGTFKSSLERLRNESLRLNSGVQTEGDAQRAWNELFQSINDTELVRKRLQEIQRINSRAVDLQRSKVNLLRSEYGHAPLDMSSITNVPSAVGGGAQPPASGPKPTVSNW